MKLALGIIVLLMVVAGGALRFLEFAPRTSLAEVAKSQSGFEAAQKLRTVSYEGVSLTYDSSLASKLEQQIVPAMAEGKPCDVVPEHPSFTLVGYPRIQNMRPSDPAIKVFSLMKFREAMSIASKKGNEGVVYPPNPPDWTTYFDEEVRVLKGLLAARPTAHIGRFVAKARGEKGCSAAMPFLPMWEACQAFAGHVRYVNFKNGQGVFFLTQWDRETEQISNDGLEYAYQGITNDGRYWVYAEFSVAAPFLPKGDEPEVVAWNEKNYLLPHNSKKYQDYLHPVVARLETLPDDQYQPNLKLLEQMIGSLEVRIK